VASTPSRPDERIAGPGSRALAGGIVALMALASVALWVGAPLLWVWVGSQLQRGSTPSLGVYLLVLAGVVVSGIVMSKVLSALDRAYGRVTHRDAPVRVRLAWHRSLRGERTSGRPTRMVDVVMVASVSAALLALGVWFFLLAGSSLPR
jgi:hypothetical protein